MDFYEMKPNIVNYGESLTPEPDLFIDMEEFYEYCIDNPTNRNNYLPTPAPEASYEPSASYEEKLGPERPFGRRLTEILAQNLDGATVSQQTVRSNDGLLDLGTRIGAIRYMSSEDDVSSDMLSLARKDIYKDY